MTITFKDENLYKIILTEVGEKIQSKNDDTRSIVITKENLYSIETLYIRYRSSKDNPPVSNLSGLEKFSGLNRLEVGINFELIDLSVLKV